MSTPSAAVRPFPTTLLTAPEQAAAPSNKDGVHIEGPAEAQPGQQLTLRLYNGAKPVSVDRWGQVLNPDKYTGNDYVTSFALAMNPQRDGSVQVTAPAPGRYKITAWRGNQRWETYVLVHPATPLPPVRGATITDQSGPLDRSYAAEVLATVKRAGVNWVALMEMGIMNMDSGEREFQAYDPSIGNELDMPLADLEWLVDEAKRQGLHVVLRPEVVVRWKGKTYELTGAPRTTATDLGIRSPRELFDAYARFMVELAVTAQQHRADALAIGIGTNTLWADDMRDGWLRLLTDLRQSFQGQLWVGTVDGNPIQASFPTWKLGAWQNSFPFWETGTADAILGIPWTIKGSAPLSLNQPGDNNPTAEQMASYIAQELNRSGPVVRQQQTGLPIIWMDLMAMNADSVNYARDTIETSQASRVPDNQEIVDYFESQMRAMAPGAEGYFIWNVSVSPQPWSWGSDPIRQPALLNAISNWWGGDFTYFSPLLLPPPKPRLASDDFEPRLVPLEPQDTLRVPITGGKGWSVVADSKAFGNHVLRGTINGGPAVPLYGGNLWTNYTITLRIRLSANDAPGSVRFRLQRFGGWDNYAVTLGWGKVTLSKNLTSRQTYTVVANYTIHGGLELGRWYQAEITAVGPDITVKLDGNQVLDFRDPNGPMLNGGVALDMNPDSSGGFVEFDDIEVDQIGPQNTPPKAEK